MSILNVLFNIKPSENERFFLMLIHAFLSGLGIALTITLINILIVNYHAVDKLPILYIVTAGLLLVKGYFYAHLEHTHQPYKLFKWVLIAISLWCFFLFVNMELSTSFVVVALAYVSYHLIYYLSNLQYWGSASLLFNVRQGKRLFAPLSAGESVAKLMGYALTAIIIKNIGTSSVFLVVAFAFGGAYIIFHRLASKYAYEMKVSHHDTSHSDKGGTVFTILSINEIFNIDNFRRAVSFFALLSTLTYSILHYVFLVKIEERYDDLGEIAVFIASLYFVSKIINLFIKSFVASRLNQLVGLKTVLLILPVSLLLVNIIGVAGIMSGQLDEEFVIWVTVILIVIDEAFRTSLYTPAYFTLFQPLTKVKRLEGHTLSKGIMEPLGLGAAGIIILTLVGVGSFNLEFITAVIFVCLILWIFAGTKVFSAYLEILSNALKSKILRRGSFELSKNEFEILKNEKLENGNSQERLYALQMLTDALDKPTKRKHIVKLFDEENAYVLQTALDFVNNEKLNDLSEEIKELITHENSEVSKRAVYYFGKNQPKNAIRHFKRIYSHVMDDNKGHIIGSAIKHGGLAGAMEFGPHLIKLQNSKDPIERASCAKIISDIGNSGYYQPLVELMEDTDVTVRASAISASGTLNNVELFEGIIRNRHNRLLRRNIRGALAQFGEDIIPAVKNLFDEVNVQEKIDIIRLFELNHSSAMSKLFVNSAENEVFDLKKEVGRFFFAKPKITTDEERQALDNLKESSLKSVDFLLNVAKTVKNYSFLRLIIHELYYVQAKHVLNCLVYKYNRKQIGQIIDNFYASSEDENNQIAIEMLDNLLDARDNRKIIPLIDKTTELNSITDLEEEFTEEDFNVIEQILNDHSTEYSSWFVGNCIRILDEQNHKIQLSEYLLESDLLIIKQEREKYLK